MACVRRDLESLAQPFIGRGAWMRLSDYLLMGTSPEPWGSCSSWQLSPGSLPLWVLSCDIRILILLPSQLLFQGQLLEGEQT